MTVKDRFWSHVYIRFAFPLPDTNCWEWLAAKKSSGYGLFRLKGKTHHAHRAAWLLTHGPIPKGLVVCHKCDNRSCVRPGHLFLGTMKENYLDMIKKGRFFPGTQTGVLSPRGIFDSTQIEYIRSSDKSSSVVAKELGCHKTTICRIRNGKTYASRR